MDILLCGWDTKPVHHIRGMSHASTTPGVTRGSPRVSQGAWGGYPLGQADQALKALTTQHAQGKLAIDVA